MSNAYYRDDKGDLIRLGKGLYGDSIFYRATGNYYLLKTCNVWTAKALRYAGCPVKPFYAVRAANVLAQTKKFGTVVREIK